MRALLGGAAWKPALRQARRRPQNLNHRVSALPYFYRYLAWPCAPPSCACRFVIPDPAHAQFIARAYSDPRDDTLAWLAARARQPPRMVRKGWNALITRTRFKRRRQPFFLIAHRARGRLTQDAVVG